MAKNKSQYDSTLNLPKTLFEMRAGLPKKEPVMLKDWDDNDLYNQLMKHNEGKPQFILHDGPPYANGNIHMGTALNKIIKDIIIREKNMEGYQAPYVPGFDTHGLPIELKALSSVGEKKKDISKLELRQICEKFATEHIDIMSDQFKRLGVIGDFEHPYLTLKPEFEARQIEIFGEMAKKGYIYKGLKPVYWCPDCRTALAEAEIEYGEDDCDSIFVRFHVSQDPNGVLAKHGIPMDKTYFVIWTTTTWTLPANEAICLNGQFEYSFVKIGDEFHIMATDLVKSVMDSCHITDYEVVGEPVSGAEFELMRYNHVYLPKEGWVILGDHVTLESGSGCVHTAGGHGVDDFNVCQKYPQVPITVPVDDGGYLTELAGHWAGPIMVGGHSKGGNLAVYAAMNASDEVKDRVERIYSLDGPGFPESVVNSFEYASVSGRIVKIVPDSSVVGMVLETPERCMVVKSDVEGIMQHFAFSWQMHGGEFDKVEDVASSSVTFNKALNKWLANLSKEQRERAVDALFAVLEASGAGSISAMMAAGPKVIPEMLGTYVGLSIEDRRNLNQALGIMLQAALARNPKVRRR